MTPCNIMEYFLHISSMTVTEQNKASGKAWRAYFIFHIDKGNFFPLQTVLNKWAKLKNVEHLTGSC